MAPLNTIKVDHVRFLLREKILKGARDASWSAVIVGYVNVSVGKRDKIVGADKERGAEAANEAQLFAPDLKELNDMRMVNGMVDDIEDWKRSPESHSKPMRMKRERIPLGKGEPFRCTSIEGHQKYCAGLIKFA